MIEKIKVRRRLALCEKEIRGKIESVRKDLQRMGSACATAEMEEIWHRSKEYAVLHAKLEVLSETLMSVVDIRCDEMLDD